MSTAAHGHDDHHAPFLAHHFEDHGHQFDSGKLGIWAFLGRALSLADSSALMSSIVVTTLRFSSKEATSLM